MDVAIHLLQSSPSEGHLWAFFKCPMVGQKIACKTSPKGMKIMQNKVQLTVKDAKNTAVPKSYNMPFANVDHPWH